MASPEEAAQAQAEYLQGQYSQKLGASAGKLASTKLKTPLKAGNRASLMTDPSTEENNTPAEAETPEDDPMAARLEQMNARQANKRGKRAGRAAPKRKPRPVWTPDDDDSDDDAAFGPDSVPGGSSNAMDAPAASAAPSESKENDEPAAPKSEDPPAAGGGDAPDESGMSAMDKMKARQAQRQKNKKGRRAAQPRPARRKRAEWKPASDDDDDDDMKFGPNAVPPSGSGGMNGIPVSAAPAEPAEDEKQPAEAKTSDDTPKKQMNANLPGPDAVPPNSSVPMLSPSTPSIRITPPDNNNKDDPSTSAVTISLSPKIIVEDAGGNEADDEAAFPLSSSPKPRESLGLPLDPVAAKMRRRQRGHGPMVPGHGKVFKSVFVSFDDVDWEILNKRLVDSKDLDGVDDDTPSESEYIDPRHVAYFKKRERQMHEKADERVRYEQQRRREVENKYNQLQRLLEEITAKNETFSPQIPKAPSDDVVESHLTEYDDGKQREQAEQPAGRSRDPNLVGYRFTNFESIRKWIKDMHDKKGFDNYGREVYVPPPQSIEASDEREIDRAKREQKFYRMHRHTMNVFNNLKKFWEKLRVVCRNVKFVEAAMAGYTEGQRQSLQRMVSRMDDHFTGLQNHLNLIKQYHRADMEEVEVISMKSSRAFEAKLNSEDKIKFALIRNYETLQNAILWAGIANRLHTTCVVVSGFPGELDHFNGRFYLQNPMIRTDPFPSWKRADPHSAVIRFFHNKFYVDSRARHGDRCVAKCTKTLNPDDVLGGGLSPDGLEWEFDYGHYTPGHVFIETRRGDKLLEWKRHAQPNRW